MQDTNEIGAYFFRKCLVTVQTDISRNPYRCTPFVHPCFIDGRERIKQQAQCNKAVMELWNIMSFVLYFAYLHLCDVRHCVVVDTLELRSSRQGPQLQRQ